MTLPADGGNARRSLFGRPSLRLDPDAQSAALGRRMALYAAALVASVLVGSALTRVNPLFVFGLVFCAIFVLIVMRWPYVGLAVYITVFILRVGEVYPVLAPLRLERVVGVLTLVSVVLAQLHGRGEVAFDRSRQTRRFVWLLAAGAATIPLAYWRARAQTEFTDFLKLFIFYLLVVQIIDTRRRLWAFVLLYGVLIAYLAVMSVVDYAHGSIQYAQGIERAVGRTSAGGGPNEMAATMASMIPVFLMLTSSKPLGGWRIVFFAGLILMTVTLVLTGSRSGALGFLASMAYFCWASKHRLILTSIAGVALIVAFFALPSQYKGRYETMTSGQLDGSSQARIRVWKEGMRMLVHRPLTGVGLGCFGIANTSTYMSWSGPQKSWLEAHSLYVQVPAEMGLIGTFAFFAFVLEFMRLNRRAARALESGAEEWAFERAILKGMFAGFVALLVTGIFGHSLLRPTWYLYAALGLTTARLYLQRDGKVSPAEQAALLG